MAPATRGTCLGQAAIIAAKSAGARLAWAAAKRNAVKTAPSGALPRHRCTRRWGQTNITAIDPTQYDIAWSRPYWKPTPTRGGIINAGSLAACYPSIEVGSQAAILPPRGSSKLLAATFSQRVVCSRRCAAVWILTDPIDD